MTFYEHPLNKSATNKNISWKRKSFPIYTLYFSLFWFKCTYVGSAQYLFYSHGWCTHSLLATDVEVRGLLPFAYNTLTDIYFIVLAPRPYWLQCTLTACRRGTQAAWEWGSGYKHGGKRYVTGWLFCTPVVELSSARMKNTYSCPGSKARFSKPP